MKTRTEVYTREDGRFAWRMIAGNGQVIATDGGQGYENRADAEEMAGRFHYDEPHAESGDRGVNPRVRAYLESLGLKAEDIAADDWDAIGYYVFLKDADGKAVLLDDGHGKVRARERHPWPEGFDFHKFIDLWALDAHTRRWKP